jgi:hypothetical protein
MTYRENMVEKLAAELRGVEARIAKKQEEFAEADRQGDTFRMIGIRRELGREQQLWTALERQRRAEAPSTEYKWSTGQVFDTPQPGPARTGVQLTAAEVAEAKREGISLQEMARRKVARENEPLRVIIDKS